jgi:hypothetical protein
MFNHELLVLLAHDHLFTERTAPLARFQKGRKAGRVESVAAGQELNGVAGRMEGFQADSTVCGSRIECTSVTRKPRGLYADPAFVTVCMVGRATDSTDPAFITVELPLVLVVQQNTDRTPIRS